MNAVVLESRSSSGPQEILAERISPCPNFSCEKTSKNAIKIEELCWLSDPHLIEVVQTFRASDDPRHFIWPLTMIVILVHRASHSSMLEKKSTFSVHSNVTAHNYTAASVRCVVIFTGVGLDVAGATSQYNKPTDSFIRKKTKKSKRFERFHNHSTSWNIIFILNIQTLHP